MEDIDVICLSTFMEDIDVIRFVYIYGGYRCSSFVFPFYVVRLFYMFYFHLFTFMEDIDRNLFCLHFVYIYGGYRCNFVLFTFMEDIDVFLFCLPFWRISM